MATIHVISAPPLLTIVAEGRLTADEVFEVIRAEYPGFRGDLMLWDLTNADTSEFSGVEFQCIALAARNVPRSGLEAKTAFVAGDDATHARLLDYIRVARACRVPAKYEVFRNTAEARQWLTAGP